MMTSPTLSSICRRSSLVRSTSPEAPTGEYALTEGSTLTRQAITKHLRVLQGAGLVQGARQGRESVFELEPDPLEEARRALENISRQWDDALARLKAFGYRPLEPWPESR